MTTDETEAEDVTTAVTVGYVHSHDVSYSWHHSLLQLVTYDLAGAGRIWRGGYVSMRCGSGELVEARNGIVREFLEQGTADWLWVVDTDMGFAPDVIDQLFAAADPVERPIVGALAFSQRELAPDGAGGWRTMASPTVFDWTHEGDRQGFAVRWDYPRDTVTAVDGTGAACVLIHRSVFERIRDELTPTPTGDMAPAGPVWFNRVPNVTTGQLFSEDLSFCVRVRALGIPIFVHTGVRTTHHKPMWVGEEAYWRERSINPPPPGAKRYRDLPAPVATLGGYASGQEKAPTKGQYAAAQAFMERGKTHTQEVEGFQLAHEIIERYETTAGVKA